MSDDSGAPPPGPERRDFKIMKRPGQPIYRVELGEWLGGVMVTRIVYEQPAPPTPGEIDGWCMYGRRPEAAKKLV
jgi:hypothetical protein